MALPDCNCIKGLSQAQKLDAIYCALLEIAQGSGGSITLSQITDLDASWIAPLQATVGSFTIEPTQINGSTNIGRTILTLAPPVSESFITVDNINNVQFVSIGQTGLTSPVNSVTFDKGIGSAA